MATRNAQTQAKRARELAIKEKRERKREKKAERRAEAAGETGTPETDVLEGSGAEELGHGSAAPNDPEGELVEQVAVARPPST